jgi:carbon-monoxide dehydrogenase medium subunit
VKPAAFDYARPSTVTEAVRLLAGAHGSARVIAGGQSLGPMLNLRLVQPELVVDIRHIPALDETADAPSACVFGSNVTHAAIEDGTGPDCTRGFMRHVARGIAYRAIRNRGTLGGSVCHADPAADWITALMLLSAVAVIEGQGGRREMLLETLVSGPYSTELADSEVLVGIRVPRLTSRARWGYFKFCRKPGEFADAIAAVLIDEERGVSRAVLGAIERAPHVITDVDLHRDPHDRECWQAAVRDAVGMDDPYRSQVCVEALRRAASQLAREA